MPGHIKKSEGADPDPDPWLIVSEELKKKLLSKPYDPKKSCWVPDKATGGYWEGLIQSKDGEKVTVQIKETGDVSKLELKRAHISMEYVYSLERKKNFLHQMYILFSDKSFQGGPSWPGESAKI